MSNLLDYLQWRGDIPLSAMPLNAIDLLVMSRVAYLPFDGVVDQSFSLPRLTLGEAIRRIRVLGREYHMQEDAALIEALMDSPRFSALEIGGYVNRFEHGTHDPDKQEQFSAVTAFLPGGNALVSFRGTDGTIVGWKENLRMAFEDAVPAQTSASEYVIKLATKIKGDIRLAGHSKGGNLAMYAAGFCGEDVQARILSVTNFDGPGFNERVSKNAAIQRVIDRIHTYMPQASVVGMLLEHEESFTIVQSQSVSIFQHDIYKWMLRRDAFITMDEHTQSSRFIDATLKEWMRDMRPELREKVVDGLFDIFQSGRGDTLRDMVRNQNPAILLRAATEMDAETRAALLEGMRLLFSAGRDALPSLRERNAETESDDTTFSRVMDTVKKYLGGH